jgi:membrane-associated HD superfamily phosphohydrolase
MTHELDGRNKLDLFGSLALGIATAGALGSLALTLQAGRHNGSAILDTLFSGWVLSPFILLIIFCVLSRRMPPKKRVSLYILIMGISIVSLLFYGRLLTFSETKPAFIFLVFPLISWIIILPSYAFLRRKYKLRS